MHNNPIQKGAVYASVPATKCTISEKTPNSDPFDSQSRAELETLVRLQVQHVFWTLLDALRLSCNGAELQLRKRRQSMPSRRTASDLGIDALALEQLVRRHDRTKRANCAVS